MDLTYKYHDFITGYGLTSNFTPNWVWSYNDKPHFFDGHNHYHLESVNNNPDLLYIGDEWGLTFALRTDIQGINNYHIGTCLIEKRNRDDRGQWDFHVGLTLDGRIKIFISHNSNATGGRTIIGSPLLMITDGITL